VERVGGKVDALMEIRIRQFQPGKRFSRGLKKSGSRSARGHTIACSPEQRKTLTTSQPYENEF
jgi:hypothetical protein